jgi:hypothetical protein
MSMATFVKSFDDGMYHDAKNWKDQESGTKCSTTQFYAAKAREAGVYPDEDVAKRREVHYLKKYQIPEDCWDGLTDRAVAIKAFARDSWSVEAAMTDMGVKMRGPLADDVDKAFGTSTALSIFPFFWDTAIQEGILAMPLLDLLVMETKNVTTGTAVHAYMSETEADRSIGEVGEFTSFPETYVVASESTVKLKKFGGIIHYSDESLRRMRIPVFQRGVARIGRQIGIRMTDFALDVLINGDTQVGGAFGAATTVAATVSGSPTYGDWVSLGTDFKIGYEPTDFVWSKTGLRKGLNIPEFKDPLSGFRFQATMIMPEIMGLQPHRWDSFYTGSPFNTTLGNATKIVMFQKNLALVQYTDGGVQSESERHIDGGWTKFVTSFWLTYGIWDRDSVRVGTGYA